jgi:dolichol-phosphate mannosyltransferase
MTQASPSVSPRKAFVTGAGGFIGANLVRRLLADGHDVVAALRPNGSTWRIDEVRHDVEIVELELSDHAAVDAALHRLRPTWLFHLSAHGAYSWQQDIKKIAQTNFLGTVNVIEACRAADCGIFIQAGSSSEYGFQDHAPAEDERPEPNSAYAVTKLAGTLFARQAALSNDLHTVTLRLYSVYGAYEDPRRLVPTLIGCGLRNQLPELVDPATGRDFVAVDDAVEAFVLAASTTTRESGAIYNIGTGTQTSVGDLVQLARESLHISAEPVWGSAAPREWDTNVWVADPRKVRSALGWRPRVDLRSGFGQTVTWLLETPAVWDRYKVGVRDPDLAAEGG